MANPLFMVVTVDASRANDNSNLGFSEDLAKIQAARMNIKAAELGISARYKLALFTKASKN